MLSRHLAGERESPPRAGAAEREDRRVLVVLGEDRGLGVVAYGEPLDAVLCARRSTCAAATAASTPTKPAHRQ
ncbi:MAG: hypothetical protein IJQ65_04780, partial [Kiritimatiellae bacterium]|nr:hypothetical protein [Kiritimatiellia bacterium]